MSYCYISMSIKCGNIQTYGIAASVNYDGHTVPIESLADVCLDLRPIERLVELCNELQLDPRHLHDVVDDFLATA